MPFYLAPFVGTGTELDPFRPPVDGPHNLIDLRPDVTQPGLCLVWSPEPPKGRSVVLGDDPAGELPAQVKRRLANDLKFNIEATRLSEIVAELAITHRTHDDDPRHPNPIDFKRRMRRDPSDGVLARYRGIYLGPPGERIWEQYYKGGPGATITESWTAADTTDGDISADLTWALTRSSKFEILSNQVTYKNDGGDSVFYRAEHDLSTDDMYVEAETYGISISANSWYVLARHHSSAITMYRWRIEADADCFIHRVVTDSFTQLASGTLSTSFDQTGQIQRFEVDGSDLEGFLAATSELTATDSNITGHTRAGIGGFANGDDRVQFDNFEAGDLAAGGTTFEEDMAGSLTPTGAMARESIKVFAGSVTGAGTAEKQTNKGFAGTSTPSGSLATVRAFVRAFAGSLTPAGTLTRRTSKTLTGSSTGSGALEVIRAFVRLFSGSITGAGSLTRETGKGLSGESTGEGELGKDSSKDLSGEATGIGTVSKSTSKTFTGTSTGSSTLETILVIVRAFTGSITPSGTLTRITNKGFSGSSTPTSTIAKHVARSLAGSITPTGLLRKTFQRLFEGSITAVSSLVTELTDIPEEVVEKIRAKRAYRDKGRSYEATDRIYRDTERS